MQVDLYLRWLLYLELFALFIVFVPFLAKLKRSILLSISPLFSKIQLIFWIFWSFVGFIFVTTIKDAYFSNNNLTSTTMDATGIIFLYFLYTSHDIICALWQNTAKLELARNERDALMSFITLLLLPIIHLHSKSVLNIYKLQQSVTAMTKQAKNASSQYMQLLKEQDTKKGGNNNNKTNKANKSDDDDKDIDTKMLRDELLLYKARLEKSNKKSKDLQLELDQAKEQLKQFDTMQKVIKKKT